MLIILNVAALIISIILSWHYIKGGAIIGCDGASTCSRVLSSQWSAIAGKIPVSGLAMGAYLTLLLANFYTDPDTEAPVSQQAWTAMLVIAGALAGIGIWFTIVQKWILGEFCPYCMTEHTIGILMAGIIIWQAGKHLPKNKLIGLTITGLLVAGVLAASQIIFAPKAAYQEGTSQSTQVPETSFADGPIVGSPNAPYIIKVLFDYNCPHCRKLHGMFDDIIKQYKGKIAFILCPAPLSPKCNKYIPYQIDAYKSSCDLAKISMAVWLADHRAFADFDKWIFSAKNGYEWQPRTTEQAKVKAIELIGEEKLNASLSSPWVENYIQASVQLYGQTLKTGRGGVPKLLSGYKWVIPELTDVGDLIMVLQKSLAVPKP